MSINSKIALFLLFFGVSPVSAVEFDPPILGSRISDDFGPRNQVKTSIGKASSPHPAIDFSEANGISIHSVEASTIREIQYNRGRGWFILARSTADPSREWRYQHLFSSASTRSTTAGSGLFRVFPAAAAGDNATIVFYADITRKVPLKAFTVDPLTETFNVPIIPGTHTISVPLVGLINEGERIGPVGRSGSATGNHLHLTLLVDGKNRNPFLYLSHPASNFSIESLDPRSAAPLTADDLPGGVFPRPLKFNINSTQGLDLNRVEVSVINPAGIETLLGGYDYQGALSSTSYPISTLQVKPISTPPGRDQFTLPSARLFASTTPAGNYQLRIRAFNIRGVSTDQLVPFTISVPIQGASIQIDTGTSTASYDPPSGGFLAQIRYTATSASGIRSHQLYTFEPNSSFAQISGTQDIPAGVAGGLPSGDYAIVVIDNADVATRLDFSLSTNSASLSTYLAGIYSTGTYERSNVVVSTSAGQLPRPDIGVEGYIGTYQNDNPPLVAASPNGTGEIFYPSNAPSNNVSGSAILGVAITSVAAITHPVRDLTLAYNARLIFAGSSGIQESGVPGFRYSNSHYETTAPDNTQLSGEELALSLGGAPIASYKYTRGGLFTSGLNQDENNPQFVMSAALPIPLSKAFEAKLQFKSNAASLCREVDGTNFLCFNAGVASPFVDFAQPFGAFHVTLESSLLTVSGTTKTFNVIDREIAKSNVALTFATSVGIARLSADSFNSSLTSPNRLEAPGPGGVSLSLTDVANAATFNQNFTVSLPFVASELEPGQAAKLRVLKTIGGQSSILTPTIAGNTASIPSASVNPADLGSYELVVVDEIPPGAVSIALSEADSDGLGFSWTAAGDDGAVGQAAAYDIRFGLCPGGTANFDDMPSLAADGEDNDFVPGISGEEQGVLVGELNPDARYCLGVKVFDAAGNSVGPYIVSARTLPLPATIQSPDLISGQPELEFQHQSPIPIDFSKLSPGSPEWNQYKQAVANQFGIQPVSNIYNIGPSGTSFAQDAQLVVRYDPGQLSGINSDSLTLYESVDDPSIAFPLPGQIHDQQNHLIVAPVRALNSKFAIFGTTTATTGSDDVLPPRTSLVIGTSISSGASTTCISSAAALGFLVFDDKLELNDGLGVGATQTLYSLDNVAYARFTSSFSLVVEGTHTLSFFSVDMNGNTEQARTRAVAVDMTPPATVLVPNGTSFELSAFDPVVNGVASGVARIRYLVDFTNPGICNNVAEDMSAVRGTCENPWYAGSFTLTNGPHTIYFQAFDAVGNAEVLRATYPFVEAPGSGPSTGGMGIGKDPLDTFWTAVSENNAIAFAHSDSSGVLISSSALPDAVSGFPWSVLFDQDGRAYAVGGAAGPATQALDLAVYKASPAGDAVESRTLFDSGYANNDIAFDAKAPGWIVGAAQTSGPTDLEASGGEFSMALWRFDAMLGTVQLKATYARAGFDLGAGLAVDADGSLWIAGYSLSPEAPAVGGFDLALWHYAADGQTLLGGPFLRPGYLDNLDGGLTARISVSSQAVYVAAPRANNAGGTDMAFLRYDKVSGLPTSEIAWRPADGAPSYPIAVLPEASGILVAGGIGGDFTEAGLWRFGFDGALHSVTTADAGGATGAVFRGSELWLSVDGSTVPYRVQSEAAVAGALVDFAPPRTSLTAGSPSSVEAQTIFVTSATPLGFAVADDYLVAGDGLGVGATQTFYAEAGGAYSRFTSSFTLVAEGTHTISFFSVDREGRAEAVKTQSVGVDLTAPVVTLVSSGTIFSITAVDPLVNGAASGVKLVQYLVDQDPDCNVEPSTAAAPGTCENLSYAGPFELAIGTHTVYYAAEDNLANGLEVVYSSYITVGQPVTGPVLTPFSGPIGVPFSITGTGFGVYGGANTRVKFGTVAAPVSVWNNTTISGTIPGLSTGSYAVAIERQNASSVTSVSAGDFAVTDLNSAALNVSSGPIGVPFTITGTGFGPYAGTLSRVLVDGATAPLSVWNNTTIAGTIPGVTPGAKTIVIQRAAGSFLSTSDGFAFEVTVPSVTAVSPSSGPIGAAYTLTGFSFGPYAGTNTRVLIGGATTALSLWNDRSIKGTVPGSLAPGVQTVVVQRLTSGGGLIQSGTVYFQVAGLALASLTPSSGPIGVPFTISGTGFGAYDGANTRVRFGVSTAALSLWNDTTISGTIPALEPGAWPVVVERQQGSSVSTSSSATFTATALSVSVLTPSSGPIGVPFTITGSQFGVYGGANTRVKFNGVVAPLSVWNDSTITGTVPALSTGAAEVVVERQQGAFVAASGISSFTIVELSPTGMTPETGPIGTAFTITGTGFGPYAGANSRVLIGGVAASLSLWNDTTISGTIPDLPAGAQPLWIERSAGTGVQSSATNYFTVTTPVVASLSPSSAPIGAPFTLTGTSFGAYGGANTRVTFNGVSAALSLWNDTTITGTVPSLPAGAVDVVVERQQGAGVVASSASAFTVLEPLLGGLSPLAGPIGTAFTLTGSGFGPYAGANTRVLIGGVAAALSLWNDTTITGTVPALPSGAQPVWLERLSGSGVSSSATSYFTITTPEVASLTPSSAPIGAPFTITGTSFGAYAGANTRVKFNGVTAPLSVWNDTTITGTVPGTLPPGDAEVIVERAAGAGLVVSATQAFYVLAPAISTVSPSFGPVGTVVTVTGAGFGPYSGSLTRLLVGGATVPLSVWNDTTIRWTVPSSLGDGEYPVVVERSPAGGTVQSASATFTVGTGYSGASFAFASTLSLASTPDTHFEGDMALSSATGGRIDTPAKAAVDIPPNAMEEDTEITLKRIKGDGLRAAAAEEIQRKAAGEPIEFGPEGTRFATPVTIELPYDPVLIADETKVAIHYYNPLRREWEELPSVVDRARKVVTAKTDHFSIYQPMGLAPMTAAQDEFYFRDAYAFPNPSRGGSVVTFRIQPGLAETVELRVYDLSGRKVHASSDFTFLGAIDDGNGKGAQNTYDHAWSVSGVGSGVYNFVIKASQRGNKPIVKSGKVGVIK